MIFTTRLSSTPTKDSSSPIRTSPQEDDEKFATISQTTRTTILIPDTSWRGRADGCRLMSFRQGHAFKCQTEFIGVMVPSAADPSIRIQPGPREYHAAPSTVNTSPSQDQPLSILSPTMAGEDIEVSCVAAAYMPLPFFSVVCPCSGPPAT